MTFVSVIVPCFNEEKSIRLLLNAIYEQTYPREKIEVVLADGMSTDKTREKISAFQRDHKDLKIRVVDNNARNIPSGLNTALKNAAGEIIVRLDAHSVPNKDYIQLCVNDLLAGKGDNVGGIWLVTPGTESPIAHAIAAAASHPFGVGNAHYRYTNTAQYVDTVPFGAFFSSLTKKIGFFNEALLTNEDYEFNARVRESGGKIWLNPEIQTVYFARDSYGKLAKQYLRYGYWKVKMLQLFPNTLRWRQAIPPLFAMSLFIFTSIGFIFPIFHLILLIELGFYAIILMIAGIQTTVKKRKIYNLILVPLAIFTMHFFWGTAFLWSLLKSITSKKKQPGTQEG